MAARRRSSTSALCPLAQRVDAFLRSHFRSADAFLVACSGGPDSVALVRLLSDIAAHRPLRFEIAHVNHALRGAASLADQRFVERLGTSLRARVSVSRAAVARDQGNLEERAREARYAALVKTARRRRMTAVLTAHTRDDQAETVFMNLLRGAGLEGLAGMRPVRREEKSGIDVARPLLAEGRTEVQSFARARGSFRRDKSNTDERFLRNYVRLSLFKQLHQRFPGFQERMARLADLVREDLPSLDRLAEETLARVARRHRGDWLIDGHLFQKESVGIQRRVLRKAAGVDLLRFDGVERLRFWMASPPTNGRVWQLRKGWFVERLSRSGGSPSTALFWFRQKPPKKER